MTTWRDPWPMSSAPERWTALRKARVVNAILSGEFPPEEAMARFDLSREELDQWIKLYSGHGLKGLRITKRYRLQDRPAPTDE